MAFGSHTHSHEILTKLSPELQREEARCSREILERELNRRVDILTYLSDSSTVSPQTPYAHLKIRVIAQRFHFMGARTTMERFGHSTYDVTVWPSEPRPFPVANNL
jgi:hypothetical protein